VNIHPAGDEFSLRTYRRSEMTNAIVAFRNFANAPKKIKKQRRKEGEYRRKTHTYTNGGMKERNTDGQIDVRHDIATKEGSCCDSLC
jgi:hypothetical protein